MFKRLFFSEWLNSELNFIFQRFSRKVEMAPVCDFESTAYPLCSTIAQRFFIGLTKSEEKMREKNSFRWESITEKIIDFQFHWNLDTILK